MNNSVSLPCSLGRNVNWQSEKLSGSQVTAEYRIWLNSKSLRALDSTRLDGTGQSSTRLPCTNSISRTVLWRFNPVQYLGRNDLGKMQDGLNDTGTTLDNVDVGF